VIDVLAADDRRGFGVMTALAIEGIPHRRIARAADFDAEVLIVARDDVDAAVVALATRVPTVVLGAPLALLEAVFGVGGVKVIEGPQSVTLEGPLWSEATRATARRFGAEGLDLPLAPVVRAAPIRVGATLVEAQQGPAVVAHGACVWTLVDVGTALANLLDEAHVAAPSGRQTPGFLRSALALYYRAPEVVRSRIQRRMYARLARRLGPTASRYPVDATGWLLLQLVTSLVRRVAGRVVRVAPWPAPYTAAGILSHDVEPTSFAYGEGLRRLLDGIAASGHAPTYGLVAGPAVRTLTPALVARLAGADVLCHGLEHQGETVVGTRNAIAQGLTTARARLEGCLGRSVAGFRSPRLDRSRDLLWALDHGGFEYDSSFPDVDRENLGRFGSGVRMTIPYRPPVEDDEGRVRESRCLELPVSAPDCIQPLFAGDDVAGLRRAVQSKIDFVRASGGLYVGIVHGGVFGPADADRRGVHLDFVRRALDHPELWLTTASAVAAWWHARERVRVRVRGQSLEIENVGAAPVAGLRVLDEQRRGTISHVVPPLAAGARVVVDAAAPREVAC
jgi:peptidoglycan/xylan/chitin deacetylase (PgdA/CDA1 family)